MVLRTPIRNLTTSMQVSEKNAPTAAIVAALSTLACCVPLGFLGAVGLASVSVWAQQYRLWHVDGPVVKVEAELQNQTSKLLQ
jgi:hypothetical protein